MGEIDEILKEEGGKLAEERARLDALGESIQQIFRVNRENFERLDALQQGKGELMECSECGCFCRKKAGNRFR